MEPAPITFTAFLGDRLLASGDLTTVVGAAKATHDARPELALLLFADAHGEVVDVDYRGSLTEVLQRLEGRLNAGSAARGVDANAASASDDEPRGEVPRGRGRPRLGVVAREVTLLPRHWEWLATQPGSVSVALRRLVDEARKRHAERDQRRAAQKAAYAFMSTMAGDQPGYEEALRALFADERTCFSAAMSAWPKDVRRHAEQLAASAFLPNAGLAEPSS